jgi:quinoprotein glucose dehydrogenase
VAVLLALFVQACSSEPSNVGWPAYGGGPGGERYSPLEQINRENVGTLQVAWTFSTGDLSHEDPSTSPEEGCDQCHAGDEAYKFEATPLFAAGRLYVSTPLNRVIALEPETGEELWRYDPQVEIKKFPRAEGYVSRGVSYWEEEAPSQKICDRRVILGTIDAELISLDAETGKPCLDFGDGGVVALGEDVGDVIPGMYAVTSPPAVVGDVVVVGSSI